jgi:Shedu protein SduA, C-terminal
MSNLDPTKPVADPSPAGSDNSPTAPQRTVPNIAFLGVCERAVHIQEGPSPLWRYNIIGLTSTVLSSIFPLPLNGIPLVFAVYDPDRLQQGCVRIISPDGSEAMRIDFLKAQDDGTVVPTSDTASLAPPREEEPYWLFLINSTSDASPAIKQPGLYRVTLLRDDTEITIGRLFFGFVKAAPLTEDRINAIRSNPLALKSAVIIILCEKCKDKIRAYVSLDRSEELESDGKMWYRELPDMFICHCGEVNMDLRIIRENMYVALENTTIENRVSFTRMYEQDSLRSICSQFSRLLDRNPEEEVAQKFIEDNPILLQQFSPTRIFYKPPILTKYNTDIVILNQKKELLLVELERPGIRMLKKDGGIAADTQHAFDQVRDWLYTTEEHRAAVLACIGLRSDEVTNIKGIVILGRDTGNNKNHLRKLKWTDFGKIAFFTYDDLLNSMVDLVRRINEL